MEPQERRTESAGEDREAYMDKKQIVLRENWRFCLEGQEDYSCGGDIEGYPRSNLSGAWYKGFDDSAWRQVSVPHDWSVELPFSRRHSSGTGYLAGGTGWYRVRFALPKEYRGRAVRVVFDGVYKNSQVWCNSYYLGKRPYGYSTFSYDITHAACFGEEENVISVKVTHTDLADSRWFTGSGITRKVTVVVEEPVHPAEYGVTFQAREVAAERTDPSHSIGRARIAVIHRTEATGTAAVHQADSMVRIRTALLDADGEAVLTLEGRTSAGGECILEGTLDKARLWSPEHPYLYTLRTWYALTGRAEGRSGEQLTQECPEEGFYLVDETRVGIRGIIFHPQKGFFLNGVETKLRGVCVHHDGGALGAAMEPEVWQRRLEILKESGCNAIRCSHNPHMPELYELCDRMGFLVMDEAFDEWENAKNKWSTGHNVYPPVHEGYFEDFPQWHEADLKAMVRRDRNHPCVILWSIGNEIDYPNDPYCHPSFGSMTGNNDANKPAAERRYDANKPNALRLVDIAADLEEMVRQEDATRPVTLAAAFPELSAETGLFRGLDVVGYNYKEHLYEQDHARFPEKPFLGSENGHGYQAWLAVRDNPYISGQFLWTGIDYLGEAHGWPVHGSPAGILTCAGDRKPEFWRRKSFWTQEPVLAIATRRASDGEESWRPMESHWNYEEGEEILVKVYSNLPKVRLRLEEGQQSQGVSAAEESQAGLGGAGELAWQRCEDSAVVQAPLAEGLGAQAQLEADGWMDGQQVGQETGERREGLQAVQDSDGHKVLDFGVLEEYNGDGEYCYRVRYQAGTLIAEGYAKEQQPSGAKPGTGAAMQIPESPVVTSSLATAGEAASLECRLWQQPDALTGQSWERASAEPGYLYQLEIRLRDAKGMPVSWQERVLSVEVSGAGTLAGLESGNLADVTAYTESRRATFRGRLLAFVRRQAPGEIPVRIYMDDKEKPLLSKTLD